MKVALLFQRLVTSVVVMAVVALLTFALIDLAPGNYLDELALNPQISAETLARMRSQYGLDQPFYRKFVQWGRSVATGDLGYSLVYQRPVRELVADRLWNTVRLNLLALVMAWAVGVALGLIAAAARGSPVDWTIAAATTILLSTPAVIIAVVVLASAARLGAALDRTVLPATAVAAVWLPAIARHVRAAMLEALAAPHMIAARARGVGRGRLLFLHAGRQALNPLTSLFGLSVAGLLSASLPVEVIMSWPGIGQLAYDAVLKRDLFLVVDLVQFSAVLLLVGNAVSDVLLQTLDPRIATS